MGILNSKSKKHLYILEEALEENFLLKIDKKNQNGCIFLYNKITKELICFIHFLDIKGSGYTDNVEIVASHQFGGVCRKFIYDKKDNILCQVLIFILSLKN